MVYLFKHYLEGSSFMPNLIWSKLNHLQRGRYAEYYAKMEFASYGYDVYTSEVDDHGVDFVVKTPNDQFLEVQVKSLMGNGYIFISESKMPVLSNSRLICYIRFEDEKEPKIFIIPSTIWNSPNEVFVRRNYDKPGQTSEPEWGINISKKNLRVIEQYSADNFFKADKG